MATNSTSQGKQTTVFILLVILAFVSVGIHLMHLAYSLSIPLLAIIALAMTCLVAGRYMRLPMEGPLIYIIAGIPVFLFAVLVFLLIPDIAINHTILTGGH